MGSHSVQRASTVSVTVISNDCRKVIGVPRHVSVTAGPLSDLLPGNAYRSGRAFAFDLAAAAEVGGAVVASGCPK
jgi:hypothetical protein